MTTINWQQQTKEIELTIRNFIDGRYEEIVGNEIISKCSSRDGIELYSFCSSSDTVLNRAVASAREAFNDGRWKGLSVHKRKAVLQKLASLIEDHKDEFALYECLDVGKPITNAIQIDVPRAVKVIRDAAEGADKLLSPSGIDGSNLTYLLRKPVGVVGSIIGWNYPLVIATRKIGPALAMGNSLVLKPSEFTSLSASLLAALAIEAGVPPGVFNVVHGNGPTLGSLMAKHPDINLLSFVGSSTTGKYLMQAAGQSNMKRLILECGGKSPFLVFNDCPDDLEAIASNIVATAFPNQGALCNAGTRLLIQEGLKEKLLPIVIEQAAKITPQDPLDPNSTFGALVNETHMHKVLNFIKSGKKEGAKLVLGGERLHKETGGYYIGPTIFDDVSPQQKIAQEEIFGPVLSVFTFKDEEDAIRLSNSTCYGLAAYAYTTNLSRTQRLGQKLNAGSIAIFSTTTPSNGGIVIGNEGHQESGFGHEGGMKGLAAYTVSSTVHLIT